MEEAKRKKYYDLRYRLSQYVVKVKEDHQRLMKTAEIKKLSAVEKQSEDFTKICDVFDRKGLLGPEKLDILKEIFPKDENAPAYHDIEETEKDISGYIQHSSKSYRQPDSSARDLVGKPFHKTSENVFYYKDAKLYFKADIDASIGLIKIAGGHGTCFRIGDKYIMTAFHVVNKHLRRLTEECEIFFGDETEPCKIKSATFFEQKYDVAILELVDHGNLPPPLTLDRNEPPSYVDIFGYPGEHILQVDMRCPICNDSEVKIKEAVSYWMTAYPSDPEKSVFYTDFEILKYRTALHSSKTFEDGASGGPITRLDKGRPVVTMMYQGGTPSFYYEKYLGTTHPMQHRIEYGISMKKIGDILQDTCQQLIKDNIFQ